MAGLLNNTSLGRPLAPWTYSNSELFELEYHALLLRRWQFVGHVCEVPENGNYITPSVGRESIIVLRGIDGKLRALKNVCRHRASRILEGSGMCRGVVQCPYHGWTYRLDGTLMARPKEENFCESDLTGLGLHEVQLEVFHGLIFVRVEGDGPSVAEQFAHTAEYFELYDVANYEVIAEVEQEIWEVNWKIVWDNYLENYHIPIAHPGLHRLIKENNVYEELDSGVAYGEFEVREKPSKVKEERSYQEQLHHANNRVPDSLKGKWVQFSYSPNLGIDLYAEMLDMFHVVPLTPEKSLIRAVFYGHRNATQEERELRELNLSINSKVNEEDKAICRRVQQGINTHGYQPGPLSKEESSVFNFHELVRTLIPISGIEDAPVSGTLAAENHRLLKR